MKLEFAKFALALGVVGLTSAHAAVNYVGDTSTSDRTTVIDLASDPTSLYGGSYDSSSKTWTWAAADTFVLQELIFISNGTLVIEAGSVVRGQPRTNDETYDPGALFIARGAKLLAEGTSADPIIFTTASTTGAAFGGRASGSSPSFWDSAPTTTPQPSSTAGRWGGVAILGNALTNVDRDAVGIQSFFEEVGSPFAVDTDDRSSIEGVPLGSSANTSGNDRFGGSIVNDNSGILKYASIRHGGANIAEANEINGLTLGGVGRATEIAFIEIWGNTDDGVEIFGGNVDLNHIAIFDVQDDGLDLDAGYHGVVQFLLVVAGQSTDKLGEWDGSYEGETVNGFATSSPVTVTKLPFANYNIYNATLIGNLDATLNNSLHIRDQAAPRLVNSLFINPLDNPIEVDNRGTANEQDSTNRFVQGVAEFRGVTAYDATFVFVAVADWVAGGAADANVEAALAVAARANYFNLNPDLNNLPNGSLASLSLNPIPGTGPGAIGSGAVDAVFEDSIASYNASIEVVDYRGAFLPALAGTSTALWTSGWTAAEVSDVIVRLGNGTN